MHHSKKLSIRTLPQFSSIGIRRGHPGSSSSGLRRRLKFQAAGDRRRQFRLKTHVRILHLGMENPAERMDQREGPAIGERNAKHHAYDGTHGHGLINPFGEFADESHRVGEKHAAVRGQADGPHGGIERGEHLRRDNHVRAAESVEKSGLPRVGVTDESDRAERHGLPRFPAKRALLANGLNIPLNFLNAVANTAAVGFEPLFAGAADKSSRSEEHTSELQSQSNLVCRLLLEKKKKND